MIPKTIHYCWFGGKPLPKSALRCIESWKKFLPDYEIKRWDESNFDVNIIPYTADAYRNKKYAYVSDYARFWVLYKYGGLYFDTDVEVIRPLDDIIEKGNFMGCQSDAIVEKKATPGVAPGLGLGVNPGLGLVKKLLDKYETLIYGELLFNGEQKTVVEYTTELLLEEGLKPIAGIQEVSEVYVYPKEYFNPISHVTMLDITPNTRTIHHYDGTWLSPKLRLKKKIIKILGKRLYGIILKFRS